MRDKKYFNFAQRWQDIEGRWLGQKKRILTMAVAAGLIVLGLAVSPELGDYYIKKQLLQINQKVSALGQVNKLLNELDAWNKVLANQNALLNQARKANQDPLKMLEKIKPLFPAEAKIEMFTYQGNALTLKVSFPGVIDVARLWVSLRDSGLFTNVDIQAVSLMDKVQSITFNLTLKQPQG